MSAEAIAKKELVVLVADKDTEYAVRGILTRHQSLRIKELTHLTDYEVFSHPEHDNGCLQRAHEFLRDFTNQYHFALVLFDREGCGKDSEPCEKLESEVTERLSANGWQDRAAVIVLDPEIENWVWSDSSEVSAVLGWQNREPMVREWLRDKGFWAEGAIKPPRPKEAMRLVLKTARTPISSALFLQLAQRVSLNRCVDPAFLKLKQTLQQWFSLEN